MRLHKLKIENITSLKGHHQIDFDHIFNHDEIFAITGPTGSGKSSILSCISLALYGDHYKTQLSSADFVTMGEATGSIALEFSIGNKKYEATWSCSVLKKNGERKKNISPSRHLYMEGQITDKKPEDVLSLDFNQFCKVVILNQNQFSKFLQSNYRDRKIILEKLLPEANLSEISKKAKERVSKIELKLGHLEKEKETLDNQIDPEIAHKAKDENHINEELKKVKANRQNLDGHKKDFQDILDLIKKYNKNLESISNKEEQINLQKKDLNKIQDAFIKADNMLKTFEEDYKIKAPLIEKAFKLDIEKTNIQENIQKFLKEISKFKENQLETQEFIKKNEALIQEIDKDINHLKEDIGSFDQNFEKIEPIFLNLKALNEKAREDQISITEKEKALNDLEIQGKKKANDLGKKEAQYITMAKDCLEASLEEIRDFSSFFDKTKLLINSNNEQLTKINEQEKEEASKAHEIKKTLKLLDQSQLAQQLEDLNKEINKNELVKNAIFSLTQVKNEKLDHCPTCLGPLNLNQTEGLLKEHAKKLNINLYQEKEKLEEEIKDEEILRQNYLLKIEHHNQRIEELKVQIKNTQKLIKDLEIKISEHKLYKENLDYQLEIEKKQNLKYLKDQISLDKNTLDQERAYFLETKNKIQALKDGHSKLNADRTQILSKLAQLGFIASDNFQETEKLFGHKQKSLFQKRTLQVKRNETEDKLKLTQKRLFDLKSSLQNAQEYHDKNNRRLNEIENIFSIEELPTNPKKEKDELEKNRVQLNAEHKKTQREKSEKERQFHSLITQKEAFLDQSRDMALLGTQIFSRLKEQLEEELKEKFQFINNWDELIDPKRDMIFLIENKIQPQIEKQLEEVIDQFQQLGQLKEKITQYLKNKNLIDKTLNAIKVSKKDLDRWGKLNDLLAKDEYRNFVLSMVEKKLIWQTNHELNGLCDGRYQILPPDQTKKAEYIVQDHWSSLGERKISTLSGGETFMISLALAFGLSELTRGSAQIDCFFVDEGFGSLDQDSTSEVYDVLMGLRNRGKQIGIISHIKDLTDKIPISITLNKGQLGDSTLGLRFN